MKSLVTGAAGQDGIILSRKLIRQGDDVVGICKKDQKQFLLDNVPGVEVVEIDLTNKEKLFSVLDRFQPDEIYNLAGFSSVNKSWDYVGDSTLLNSLLPAFFLEWIKKYSDETRFTQASSSEIFGGATSGPQNEFSEISPITPYGLSKSHAHMLVRLYRQEYGLFASNAILYNHESPLRKLEFVTRHVSNSVAEIFCGRREFLEIGNLDAFRDWGWAPDYVAGMILLSKSTKPGDFIFATGKKHSVGELVETAFQSLGIDNYKDFIRIKGSNVRKVDPGNLYGDPTNAVEHLGWKCTLDFYEIVKIMVQSDLQVLQTDGEYSWLSDSKFWD